MIGRLQRPGWGLGLRADARGSFDHAPGSRHVDPRYQRRDANRLRHRDACPGTSTALVGASDFTTHTSSTRLLFLSNSLIGASVLSLTLTYLMQVYTALRRRNVLALSISSPLRLYR